MKKLCFLFSLFFLNSNINAALSSIPEELLPELDTLVLHFELHRSGEADQDWYDCLELFSNTLSSLADRGEEEVMTEQEFDLLFDCMRTLHTIAHANEDIHGAMSGALFKKE